MANRKAAESIQAHTSATVIAHHIPSTPKKTGRSSTEAVWKISVRINEMAAETAPLLSAVKKDEANILSPASRKENANSRNA